jgi:hypothetical protein
MSIPLQLFSGVLAATDTVACTVPAGQMWRVSSITLSQPTGAATATASVALNGTSLTAANVRLLQTLTTGSAQAYSLFPGFVLPPGTTLNASCTTAAQTNMTINGTKEVIT